MHRDEDIVETMPCAHVVVHVVRRHYFDAETLGQAGEGVDTFAVAEGIVVLKLDVEAVAEDALVFGGDRL